MAVWVTIQTCLWFGSSSRNFSLFDLTCAEYIGYFFIYPFIGYNITMGCGGAGLDFPKYNLLRVGIGAFVSLIYIH